MRILIATPLYPPEEGGPATYTKLLEQELPKLGFDVVVLPFSTVRHLPKVLRHIAYFFKVLARGRGVDIIYAQDAVSVGFPAALANIFLCKKFVLKIVGDHAWEQGKQRFGVKEELDAFPRWSARWPLALRLIRRAQFYTVRRASLIIVPSDYLKRLVEKWGAVDVRRIYNGVDFAETPAAVPRPEGKLIVTVARLVPWKGVDSLIDVTAQESSWSLVVLGDGPQRKELEARAQKTNGRVRFLGRVSHAEILGWLGTCDAFALNSTYEGLSHTLVEALHMGAPTVATNVGGNPEVVEDSVSGLLVPAGDEAALHAALTRVLEGGELAARLRAGARERARCFSVEATVTELCDILRTV